LAAVKLKRSEIAGKSIIYLILAVTAFSTVYPFWYVIMYSLSDSQAAMGGGFFFVPKRFSLEAYRMIITTKQIFTVYRNSIFVTFVGTALSLVMTSLIAYPLSLKRFKGRRSLALAIFFTMLFQSGMIPNFLLVRDLGLYNSLWSLILPLMINAYNMFIMRTYFQSLPPSLEESASIDGANPFTILARIIVPLSKPVFAAMAMFYGVAYWNDYFHCILYINDQNKQILQVYLRRLLLTSSLQTDTAEFLSSVALTEKTMIMTTITVAVIPILVIYPWLQKYYVKGMLIGSIKG
jgi:putative aldouronate transport system permease protein